MKAKIKLDPNALKQFFIDHVEKIAFGVVVACFLLMVYSAVARDTLKWGPEDLVRDADDAKKNVASTKASPPQYTSYTGIVKDLGKPIAETDYTLKTVWEPLKFDENIPRGVPKLYPVTDLRCGAGDGAFAMTPPEQDEEEAAPAGPTRGQRWAVITGLIQHRKQKEAYDATFQEAAQWDQQRDYPDYVFYRVERAEIDPRSETAEPKWTTVRVRDMLALQDLWMRPGSDIVDDVYLPPQRGSVAIAFPLGPLQDREWGPEVAHPPEIPALEAGERGGGMPGRRSIRGGASAAASGKGAAKGAEGEAEAGEEPAKSDDATKKAAARKAKKPAKRPADQPDEPDAFDAAGGASAGPSLGASRTGRGRGSAGAAGGMPGMSGMMPGMMPGGPGGMRPGARGGPRTQSPADAEEYVEEKELDHLLFRFFDFTVEPGKHYRYRVKLVLANPNHGMMSHFLEKEGMEKPQYLETEWSEPSPEVSVPLDSQVLTVSAKGSDGSANMMLVRFNMSDGQVATDEITVPRGQLLDYRQRPLSDASGEKRRPQADGETDEPKVDFLTNSLLLDVVGGARLPGKDRNLLEPGSVLLLDPEGALVVRSEIDDLTEIERRKQRETANSQYAGGRGAMTPGGEPPTPMKPPKKGAKKPGSKGGPAAGSSMPGMSGMMPGGMTPGMMPGGMPGASGSGMGDIDDGRKRSKGAKKRGG